MILNHILALDNHSSTMPSKAISLDSGRYIAVCRLGEGSLGPVLAVKDTSASSDQTRFLVVKCVAKQSPKSHALITLALSLEARVSDHSAVLGHTGVFDGGSYHGIVSDLCQSGTLLEAIHLRLFHYFDPRPVGIIPQLADAMNFCHKQGVYNVDLSPHNIFLSGDPTSIIRLSDFTMATSDKKRRGMFGRAEYMAPGMLPFLSFIPDDSLDCRGYRRKIV